MANVQGPLFSLEAHGTLGPICYQQGRRGPRVILPRSGIYPNTVDQQQVKANFAFANYLWVTSSNAEKNLWRSRSDFRGRTGKDHFMRVALERMLTGVKTSQQKIRARPFPFAYDDNSIVLNFDGPNDAQWFNLGDPEITFVPETANYYTRSHPNFRACDCDSSLTHTAKADIPSPIHLAEFSLAIDVKKEVLYDLGYFFTLYRPSGAVLRFCQTPEYYEFDFTAVYRNSAATYYLHCDAPSTDRFYHYTFELNGTTLALYCNGTLQDSETISGSPYTATECCTIGKDHYTGQSARRPALSPFDNIVFTKSFHEPLREPFR